MLRANSLKKAVRQVIEEAGKGTRQRKRLLKMLGAPLFRKQGNLKIHIGNVGHPKKKKKKKKKSSEIHDPGNIKIKLKITFKKKKSSIKLTMGNKRLTREFPF